MNKKSLRMSKILDNEILKFVKVIPNWLNFKSYSMYKRFKWIFAKFEIKDLICILYNV